VLAVGLDRNTIKENMWGHVMMQKKALESVEAFVENFAD
jgi:hypothetical protein